MSYELIALKGYRGLAAKVLALPHAHRVIYKDSDFTQMQLREKILLLSIRNYMQANNFFATQCEIKSAFFAPLKIIWRMGD